MKKWILGNLKREWELYSAEDNTRVEKRTKKERIPSTSEGREMIISLKMATLYEVDTEAQLM